MLLANHVAWFSNNSISRRKQRNRPIFACKNIEDCKIYFCDKNWELTEDFLGVNGPIWVLPLWP